MACILTNKNVHFKNIKTYMQHYSKSSEKKKKPKVSMGKAFKTIIWPRRNLVFIGLILIVIKSLSGLILPWQSKILLDDVVPNKDFDKLYSLLGIVIIAIVLQAITSFLLTRILSVQAQYLISELRAQVQKKVLSLPISFFDNTPSSTELYTLSLHDALPIFSRTCPTTIVENQSNFIKINILRYLTKNFVFCIWENHPEFSDLI